jgi:NAD+ diphosphatase
MARVVGVTPDGRVLSDPATGGLRWLAATGPYDPETVLCIGLVDDTPQFAIVVADDGTATSLRMMTSSISDTDRDVATTAVALANWHRVAPYCGICGGLTEVRSGGHVRWCPNCDRERYPRTDPAVIVSILDDRDRLLLGHQTAWETGRVSVLAGFVESGESLEQAIRREVREEAAIELGELRYFGSQPHPYPRSLMLAFVARAETTDIRVDGKELGWAGFFTPEEVNERVREGSLLLPAKSSIASRMIRLWLAGELPAPR